MGFFRDLPAAEDIEFFPRTKNFIKTMVFHNCARPWYVYVETFFPAAIELAVAVTLFEVDDAIRQHGEKIVSEGKGGRLRKGRHTGGIRIPGRDTKTQKWSRNGLKALLVITSPLEALGFAWLMYSAVDNFFFNWQTLIENSDFCDQPIESGPFQRSRGPGVIPMAAAGIPIPMGPVVQNRGNWSSGQFNVTLPEGIFFASLGCRVRGPTNVAEPVFVRFRVFSVLGFDFIDGDHTTIGAHEEASLTVAATFFLPTAFGGTCQWEIAGVSIPIGIEVIDAHVTVQRTG